MQCDIIVDGKPVDGPEVRKAVFVLHNVRVVYSHSILCVGAQDLHLRQKK